MAWSGLEGQDQGSTLVWPPQRGPEDPAGPQGPSARRKGMERTLVCLSSQTRTRLRAFLPHAKRTWTVNIDFIQKFYGGRNTTFEKTRSGVLPHTCEVHVESQHRQEKLSLRIT